MIQSDKTIEMYFQQIKDKYPQLSLEQVQKICRTPFLYIRRKMENLEFPLIHIKYLGKFLVYPGKVKSLLRTMIAKKRKGEITEKEYIENTKYLEAYLNKCKDEELDEDY